jgi:Putative zinc-finger
VDCLEYTREYLAAHADGELSPQQQSVADAHLAECDQCRLRLIRERALKQAIRQQVRLNKAPAELRLRIRASLNEPSFATTVPPTGMRGSSRPTRHAHDLPNRETARLFPAQWLRTRLWIPIGITGSLVLLMALLSGRLIPPPEAAARMSVPAFDVAISKYLEFRRDFQPNVPREVYDTGDGILFAWVMDRNSIERVSDDGPESEDISRAYRDADMPDDLFDFSSAGYQIAGGRVDHLPDGRPVTYTMYQSDAGQIVSLCFSDATLAAPIGAVDWLGMRSFYSYKGYSICLSFYPTGHFVSILVTRMPVEQLLREVANTDALAISR